MTSRNRPEAAASLPSAALDLHEQALHWLVTHWSGEMSAVERRAFEQWLAQPGHAGAWQQVQRINGLLHDATLDQAPDRALLAEVLRGAGGHRRRERRALLRSLLLGLGVGGVVTLGRHVVPWRTMVAEYRSGRGERTRVGLADGGEVVLNTASALDVVYDAAARRLLLRSGEIFIVTAPDTHALPRPFVVETDYGTIRALGTRFEVAQENEGIRVAVYEGAVEVRPGGLAEGAATRLEAGRQMRFDRHAVQQDIALVQPRPAWTQGQLIAERMTLDAFLAEVARYRSGFVRCDPDVAELIVSGVYPLDDTDRTLAMLAQALPVKVVFRTPYWVTVTRP